MVKGYYLLFMVRPQLAFSLNEPGMDKGTLVRIIIVLLVLLLVLSTFEIRRALRKRKKWNLFRYFKKVMLEVSLEKDRTFRPQVLTLTISNTGKHEASIEAPVLEYSKIWSKRRFRLNGINGNQIYPMFIDPGKIHQLHIETSTFYQYDNTIKSFYWARIKVMDVEGRKWYSNEIKLRKSLVT